MATAVKEYLSFTAVAIISSSRDSPMTRCRGKYSLASSPVISNIFVFLTLRGSTQEVSNAWCGWEIIAFLSAVGVIGNAI